MRYVKVPHPKRGLVRFVPWDYQAQLMRDQSRGILVVKARQTGISTALCSGRVAWRLTHDPESLTLIVSRKGDTAAELMRMVRRAVTTAHEQDPTTPPIIKDNQMELVVSHHPYESRVICETASPNAGRTYTANEVILDEFAFMEYSGEIWTSVWPTLSRGGSLLAVSTPASIPATLFEQLWRDERLKFKRYLLSWQVCPDYTEEWAEQTRNDLGSDRRFAQEFGCDFAAAAQPYFPAQAIERCYEVWGAPPSAETGTPEPGHLYMISADIAGVGSDLTVVGVWDITTEPWQLVWNEEFERITPADLAALLNGWGEKWDAELVIDASGLGEMLLGSLGGRAVGLRIVGGGTWREEEKMGYRLMSVAKEKLLAHAMLCMDQGRVGLPQMPRLDQELRQYHLPDTHVACDWVMMAAIGIWYADEETRLNQETTEVVTLSELMPEFRPVRAVNQRGGTDDLWHRGV